MDNEYLNDIVAKKKEYLNDMVKHGSIILQEKSLHKRIGIVVKILENMLVSLKYEHPPVTFERGSEHNAQLCLTFFFSFYPTLTLGTYFIPPAAHLNSRHLRCGACMLYSESDCQCDGVTFGQSFFKQRTGSTADAV